MERWEWTPVQKLFTAVDPEWDRHYDEPPVVDEERLWQAVASTLEPGEALVLELRFGRRLGYSLTLKAVGAVLKRQTGPGIGVSRERVRAIEAKALRKLRHPTRYKLLQEATSPATQEKSDRVREMRKKELRERGVNI